MNQINYQPIQLALRKWLEERHLSISSQKENLLGNVMEELTEMVRANSDEELLDSLCDIMVFTSNASNHKITTLYLDSLPSVYLSQAMTSKEEFIIDIVDNIMFDTTDNILLMCIKNIIDLGYDPIACMNETIKEISSRKGQWNEHVGKFVKANGIYNDKVSLAKFEATYRAMNPNDNVYFDYYDDRLDVILDYGKEIETYILWYKANYSKCKKH